MQFEDYMKPITKALDVLHINIKFVNLALHIAYNIDIKLNSYL